MALTDLVLLIGGAESVQLLIHDMALPDVLIALTACPRRGDFSRPCGAAYVEPLGCSVTADLVI
jgi:hypothetical protein